MNGSPYYGATFIGFFLTLAKRLGSFLLGNPVPLASDELQLLVLAGVAVSAALVGTFLVLRRLTMLANSLSHTILLGIVGVHLLLRSITLAYPKSVGFSQGEGGYIFCILFGAVVAGLVTTFLTEWLHRRMKLKEEAANGLVFAALFSLGIVLVSLWTRSSHIGLDWILGNSDILHVRDLKMIAWVVVINLGITFLCFRPYQLTTFDPGFARSIGFSSAFFHYLLMGQTSLTVVGGFRAVGVVMVLSFLIGPVLSARLVTHHLPKLLITAIGIALLATLLGVATARHCLSVYQMPLATSGIIVCFLILIYTLLLVGKRVKNSLYRRAYRQVALPAKYSIN